MDLYDRIEFILVKGNHDILVPELYNASTLLVVDTYRIGPFILSHKEEKDSILYNISGHVHPSVRLKGKAKQGLRLPCFYFGEFAGLLPAYGNFTGTYPIRPKVGDRIYGILENSVISLMQLKTVY